MDAYTEADFNILNNKVKELESQIEKLERDFISWNYTIAVNR